MYIVVIEGTDGSGKQTQTAKLFERLSEEGLDVIKQSFPNYDSPSSAPVKMYLDGELCENASELDAYQTSSLFAVDRLCTYKKLARNMTGNEIVIFDRYVESNMLHQACKISDKIERANFVKWLDNFEFGTLKLPRPNKVIFLDMPPEVRKNLLSKREISKFGSDKKDIHEKDEQHLLDAYATGKAMAKKFDWHIVKCVDGERLRTREEISDEIFDIVVKDVIKQQLASGDLF